MGEQRMGARGKQSAMKVALGSELADAKCQMRNRSAYEHGGRAELNDAVSMHRVQRCSMRTSNVAGKSSRRCILARCRRLGLAGLANVQLFWPSERMLGRPSMCVQRCSYFELAHLM